MLSPKSGRIAAALVAATTLAALRVSAAAAGQWPAGDRRPNAITSGPTEPNASTEVELGAVSLGKEIAGLDDRRLRMRRLGVLPGGVVPWHSHVDRPELVLIVSGEILEYRTNWASPILHKAGDVLSDEDGISHYRVNNRKSPAELLSADIVNDKKNSLRSQMSEKIAVITGSHKGLGFEIARQLAKQHGYTVIVTARTAADSDAAFSRLVAEGLKADHHSLDVTNEDSTASFIKWLEEKHGRADMLVNNAAIFPPGAEENSVLTAQPAMLLKTIETNAAGMLRMSQVIVPLMQRQHYGRIVNVSTEVAALSLMDDDVYPMAVTYRTSKVAMNALTVLLARELKGTNILVNCYSPGWMQTDMGGPNAPYSVQEGAQTAVYLATLQDNGPTGRFVAEMRKFGGPVDLPW